LVLARDIIIDFIFFYLNHLILTFVDLSEWFEEDAYGKVKRWEFSGEKIEVILFNVFPVQRRIRNN